LSLRLSQQAIIVTSVPFVFEIVLLVLIVVLLQLGAGELKQEMRAREIVTHCNRLSSLLVQDAASVASYWMVGTRQEAVREKLTADKKLEAIELASLDKYLGEDFDKSSGNTCVVELRAIFDAMQDVFAPVYRADQEGLSNVGHAARLKPLLERLVDKVNTLVDLQTQSVVSARQRYERVQSVLQIICGLAFVLSLLIAIAVFRFFNQGVLSRASVVAGNTRRLAANQALMPALDGGDEFADIDRAFRVMAHDLEQANLKRTELLQMVAHDLRSPLSSILISLEFLRSNKRGELPVPAHKEVASIMRGTAKLVKLINDLLDLETLRSANIPIGQKRVALAWLISQSVELVQAKADQKKITIEYPEVAPYAFIDPERIEQVLVNLLTNAIKFSPENSAIEVVVQSGKPRQSNNGISPDFAEISVIDQGRGVPPELIDTLFDQFTQITKEDRKEGSGLGLAISKALVNAHGGKIGCESTDYNGSRFWFTIPVFRLDR
jgi:signal transduction histidine kinase